MGAFGEPRMYFAEYQTSVGEIRTVALREGSTVELDGTASFDTDANGVGERPVTGLFDARNLDTLLTSLERALPITVTRLPGFILISVNSGRDSPSLLKERVRICNSDGSRRIASARTFILKGDSCHAFPA